MIDFKKKISKEKKIKVTNPIEIYNALDRKSSAGPLRPVQEYVLTEWFDKRINDKDLIVKLHTGEGRTLIGLLMLQTAINLGEGPCLYVCPNKYLVEQVCDEAEKFGISFCTIPNENIIPNEYLAGERILITHAHKIFNGRSIFGINNNYQKAGTIVLDDSHACVDILKDAFTISIKKDTDNDLYNEIITLFSEELREQGEGSFLDIKNENSEIFMIVPYWALINKKREFLECLSNKSNSDVVRFTWPLIKDNIIECSCFISGDKVEILPYNISVETFGTFSKAKRRILMSATTQEDIFFIKGLDFSVNAVKNPLIYPKARWSGEKMIIIPSLIDERCDTDLIATTFAKKSYEKFGIVSIVSNTKRAKYYNDLGATHPKNNEDLIETINNLKKGIFNKTIIINNRYDGIDLPDECCRILIIDSIPHLNNYSDKYQEKCCPNNEIINKKIAQKIEQGIGRAVRGEKDYCAIIIIGSDIIKFMRSVQTKNYFSKQTQKQIDIGLQIAEMSKDEVSEDNLPMKPICSLLKQIIYRDEGWKEYYTNEMNSITDEENKSNMYERYKAESELEKLFSQREYEKAAEKTQEFIDKLKDDLDDLEKGWYLEKMARYSYMFSKEKSINLQKSAFNKNNQLLKPRDGITYSKTEYLNENRINKIKKYLKKYENFKEFNLHINEILDNFSFKKDSNKFEDSLKSIGEFLGYESQRPDQEIRKGPDNLWCISNKRYIVFECKNNVDENRRSINKSEAGQFNNHCAWFKEEYGDDVDVLHVMIIPTRNLAYEANFNEKVFVMRTGKLQKFKENIKGFISEIRKYKLDSFSDEKIQEYLDMYNLNMENFQDNYVEEIYHLTSNK